MRISLIEELTIRGKGLRANLRIITTLIFLVPSIAVAYIISNTKTTVQLEIYHIITFVFTLVLVLVGMIILRQLFDEIIEITSNLKSAERGEKVIVDLNKSTSELHDISLSFNRLLEKMEINNEVIAKQAVELDRAIKARKLAEEKLKDPRLQQASLGRKNGLDEMATKITQEIYYPLNIISHSNKVLKNYFSSHTAASFENIAIRDIDEHVSQICAIISKVCDFARCGGDAPEMAD